MSLKLSKPQKYVLSLHRKSGLCLLTTESAEKVVCKKRKQILAKNDCQKFAQNKNSP